MFVCANDEGDEVVLISKTIPYSSENIAIAAAEAYNGEYTIEDNGAPMPEPTDAERITELEATLNALLGVNE